VTLKRRPCRPAARVEPDLPPRVGLSPQVGGAGSTTVPTTPIRKEYAARGAVRSRRTSARRPGGLPVAGTVAAKPVVRGKLESREDLHPTVTQREKEGLAPKPPCRVCLPAVPRHTRQRIITRPDGTREQRCELCNALVALLGKPELVEME
jgi:hypothetical protein